MPVGKNRRFVYLATAFVVLVFMGFVYAWSLFVGPIEAETGWDRTQTSFVFTVTMISFCVGMLAAGSVEQRFSPRIIMIATGLLIGAGFIAASFVTTLPGIYLTYGVMVGLGVGVGTDAVMSVAVKWYPEKQGLATGGMLMGFGVGSLLLSPLATFLMGAFSWRTAFMIFGVLFALVMAADSLIVKNPPQGYAEALLGQVRAGSSPGASEGDRHDVAACRDFTPAQMVRTRSFWTFFCWIIMVCSGGLALISQAVPAAQEVLVGNGMEASAAVVLATGAMGGISLCNGLGRFGNGFVWDKLGYRVSLLWISAFLVLSMGCCGLAVFLGSFPLIVVGFMLLGLTYGGAMGALAAMSGDFFGTRHFGINYAVAATQMFVSAIAGPLILARMQSVSGSYGSAFWVFMGIAIVAFALSFFIKKPE